jgi:two-component system nitrogen regulation sensor histidine kinase NtrY
MRELLAEVMRRPERDRHAEIRLEREGIARTLIVGLAAESVAGDVVGYVATFDDISDLLAAQRQAAWADVARRIAHEIKNPLTPIQLSAERLKRKYLKQIAADPETFASCVETIVRQVQDIGRMVDEFSAFARMPQPQMRDEDLADICRQAVFLERNRHPEIAYSLDLPAGRLPLRCDPRQVSQALTNLLKNAAESISERPSPADGELAPGQIRIGVRSEADADGPLTAVTVEDNGRGLPAEERHRLTEPYVTTRVKGTGLGLAIVKKIMEDHRGNLILEDRPGGGARVTLVFRPAATPAGDAGPPTDPLDTATRIVAHGA